MGTGRVRRGKPISFDFSCSAAGELWPISEMAVARVGGRLLGWSCRHCGISHGATYAPDCHGGNYPRTAAEAPGSGGRTDGLRTSPRREGRVVGASEMATGVVVGSAMILAPASSPTVWPKNAQAFPGTSATVLAPGCAVGAVVAAIAMHPNLFAHSSRVFVPWRTE
jgi:hypothetical protein